MSIFDFKGRAEANAWKNDLKTLNEDTNMVLDAVAHCIDEIKLESAGDPVEQLVITAADLADAAANVIIGLKGLEDAIDNIIGILMQGLADTVDMIVTGRDKSTNL